MSQPPDIPNAPGATPPPQQVLEHVLETTRDFIGAIDCEFRFIAFNRAFREEFARVFGRNIERGQSLIEATAHLPGQQDKFVALGRRALAGEEFTVTEAFGPDPERQRHYEISYAPLRDGQGRLYGATLIARDVTARARAESEVRRAEQHYRSIYENVAEGIFQTTPDGQYLMANNALARIYGYENAEELMRAVKDIRQQVYVDEGRRAEFARLLQERDVITDFESQVRRKDGSMIWIAENAHAVRDAQGKLLYYEGTVSDVTERRSFQEAVRNSEILYHSLVETLPLNIFRKDAEGRFTFGNKRFCDTIGTPPPALIGKTDFDFFPRELAQKYRDDDVALMNSRGVVDVVEENRQSDGRIHYVHTMKTPLLDAYGRVVGVQGIFWDVTERRRIEEALAHERDLLRALLDNVPDRIYFKDTQSRFLRCSRALAERLGVSDPATVIGKSDFDFHPQEKAQEFFDDEQRIITTGVPLINKIEHQTGVGRPEAWASVTKVPIYNEAGHIVGIVGISRDITELKRIEAELEINRDAALEMARQKSQFLATMSHEIRTPMNGIVGMIGLLLDTRLTNKQMDFVETIRTSAETLLTIINDILDFSKIEAGKLAFESIDFDLREAIEATAELLADRAHGKGIELITHVPVEVPTTVRGDPGRFGQVLTNLVGNAIKFTEHGEVLVRVVKQSEDDSGVVLRVLVSDTGIGVPPEAQARIFQAFTQADGSTTRRFGGTGLGLSISRQLVELMRGQMGMESEPGRGSTFWFELPFARAQTPAQPRRHTFPGVRTLVVDDNAAARQFLAQDIAALGIETDTAATPAEAIERLEAQAATGRPYRVIIADIDMAGMDGSALATAVHENPQVPAMKFVLLTYPGAEPDRAVLVEKGIAATLTKPVRYKRMVNALRLALLGEITEAEAPFKHESAAPTTGGETASSKLQILVVEDNVVNRKVALQQLQKLGFTADTAADGDAAIKETGRKRYDVILMDCQMPGVDGFEAAREIRRREAADGRGEHAYIVAMTANALAGDREQCIGAGMDDYIDKPVQLAKLRAALSRGRQHAAAQSLAEPTTTTDPAADTASPLDFSILAELASPAEPDQPSPLIELIDIFVRDAETQLARIHANSGSGDRAGLRLAAHTLKGSAVNLGARDLAGVCAQIEAQAKTDGMVLDSNLLNRLTTEFQRVKSALDTEKHRLMSKK